MSEDDTRAALLRGWISGLAEAAGRDPSDLAAGLDLVADGHATQTVYAVLHEQDRL